MSIGSCPPHSSTRRFRARPEEGARPVVNALDPRLSACAALRRPYHTGCVRMVGARSRLLAATLRHGAGSTAPGSFSRGWLWGLLALWVLHVPAIAASDIGGLEGMVREWMALRREINRTRTDWVDQKSLLEDETRLLRTQKETLAKRLSGYTSQAETAEKRLADTTAKTGELGAGLEALHQPLLQAEADLVTRTGRLPEPLLHSVRSLVDGVVARGGRPPTVEDLADRLQAVVSLCTHLQQLTQGVHSANVTLPDDAGRQREMQALFLGLSVAYAVSADGAQAARGCPGPDGWVWEWDDSLAPAVRQCLACYRKEAPAEFVTLPLRLGETP